MSGGEPECPRHTISNRRARAPLDELALSCTAEEFLPFDQNAPAGEHNIRHTGDLDAFEHGIVDAHVMGLSADGVFALGIENDQVCVAADCDSPFARIESKEFRRCGGGQFDEAVYAEASSRDAARINQAHAVFDAGASVRNFGEVTDP